ncbi:hypothetical protein ACFL20_12300 [Spirochaetota bacterium]
MNRDEITKKIKMGDAIIIEFPVINESIQGLLHFIIDEILKYYKRLDLTECIYSAIKELIINGIKANIKHIIFKEYNVDANNEKSMIEGLKVLKKLMTEKNFHELEKKARENDLKVKIDFLHDKERVIAIVENNSEMSKYEDKRIREKFKKALNYESIADYYMDGVDDSEGSGIGITMVVLLLKGSNIDPHSFTIDTKEDKLTRARIEFPIDPGSDIRRNK